MTACLLPVVSDHEATSRPVHQPIKFQHNWAMLVHNVYSCVCQIVFL